MRTTIAIDDDVLAAAKGLAAQRHQSIGEVISSLVRQALKPAAPINEMQDGLPSLPFRPDAIPVTLEMVNRLRDDLI